MRAFLAGPHNYKGLFEDLDSSIGSGENWVSGIVRIESKVMYYISQRYTCVCMCGTWRDFLGMTVVGIQGSGGSDPFWVTYAEVAPLDLNQHRL